MKRESEREQEKGRGREKTDKHTEAGRRDKRTVRGRYRGGGGGYKVGQTEKNDCISRHLSQNTINVAR